MRASTTVGRLLAGAVLFTACAVQAITLSLVPSSPTVAQGDTQTFDLQASDLSPTADALSGFDVNIGFDPTYVQYVGGSATPGAALGVPAPLFFEFPNPLFVELFAASNDSAANLISLQATQPFTLASLSFIATLPTPANVAALFDISVNDLTGIVQGSDTDLCSPTAPCTTQFATLGASLTITPRPITVPEPASVVLIGGGLLLLAARRGRAAR